MSQSPGRSDCKRLKFGVESVSEDESFEENCSQIPSKKSKTMFIAVHLGAGNHSEKRSVEYRKICDNVCRKAMELLRSDKPAGDAVVEAIKGLEDSRILNAGSGSNLTIDGTVECDAGYMDGEGYFGAVGAVPGVPNPILAAKTLADTHKKEKLFSRGRVPPTFLVGQSAKTFCANNEVRTCDDKEMISEKAQKTYEKYMKNLIETVQEEVNDTVGAIALDCNGNVASGVSSGGNWLKFSGRIGHSPLFGCGCWSSNLSPGAKRKTNGAVATSVSGSGEILSRVRLAEMCALESRKKYGTYAIRETVLNHVLENNSLTIHAEPRYAGVIALYFDGRRGEFSWTHSSKNFVLGYLKNDWKHPKFQFSELEQGLEPGKFVTTGGTSF